MRVSRLAPIAVCCLALAGCGTDPGDRGLSGGLLGAGTGAAIGSLVGGSAATGALLGGVGGLALGILTSPDQIDLGPAPWHRVASRHRTERVARDDEKCVTRDTATQRITTCTRRK